MNRQPSFYIVCPMSVLSGKHIILGVTGSIAAYKAASLIRLLVKQGAQVKVVMTPLAKAFITPLTLATLSKNPILVDFYNPENGDWNSHVDLGIWADLYLIAPASANTIGKMATGVADNLLLTTYLSAKCPVMVAPAMDLDMYRHPATRKNLETLQSYGNLVIEPQCGELASGLVGAGRMEEPEKIVEALVRFFTPNDLAGVRALVTAGPTYENIDPVRFIGNHSSGRMGFALAEELADRGAEVTLITGPVALSTDHPGIRRVDVTGADAMYEETVAVFEQSDVAVMCAAVSDFTPAAVSPQKLKRGGESLSLVLHPTRDIAAELGRRKRPGQCLVGFALEDSDEEARAGEKLRRKNLDLIVLNSLRHEGAGFGRDTNRVTLIDASGTHRRGGLKGKREVAADIVDQIVVLIDDTNLILKTDE